MPWDQPELGGGEQRWGGGSLSEAPQKGQRLPVGSGGWAGSGQLRRVFLEDQQQIKNIEVTTGGLHLQDTIRSLR